MATKINPPPISVDELGFFLEILNEERSKPFTIMQRCWRLQRAGEFLALKQESDIKTTELSNFMMETALRAAANAYIIAEKIKI